MGHTQLIRGNNVKNKTRRDTRAVIIARRLKIQILFSAIIPGVKKVYALRTRELNVCSRTGNLIVSEKERDQQKETDK